MRVGFTRSGGRGALLIASGRSVPGWSAETIRRRSPHGSTASQPHVKPKASLYRLILSDPCATKFIWINDQIKQTNLSSNPIPAQLIYVSSMGINSAEVEVSHMSAKLTSLTRKRTRWTSSRWPATSPRSWLHWYSGSPAVVHSWTEPCNLRMWVALASRSLKPSRLPRRPLALLQRWNLTMTILWPIMAHVKPKDSSYGAPCLYFVQQLMRAARTSYKNKFLLSTPSVF